MRLPNRHHLVIDREKVCNYLLNPEHPDNGGKAAFFLGLGFCVAEWEGFAAALRRLAASNDVKKTLETRHGMKHL
ncbi:hypothetical protein HZA57_01770 [Candidatus Poribacteria bacterium]|nr:hypothetical protein [Candidatus Poribacteria bacterium]